MFLIGGNLLLVIMRNLVLFVQPKMFFLKISNLDLCIHNTMYHMKNRSNAQINQSNGCPERGSWCTNDPRHKVRG